MNPRAALLILSALCLLPTSATAQDSRRSWAWQWGELGTVLLAPGSQRLDPLTLEPAPAPTTTEKPVAPATKPDLAEAVATAITKSGGKATASALRGRPTMSTLPRAPEANPPLAETADGAHAVGVNAGELWAYDAKAGARRLAETVGAIRRLEVAPDGRAASFLDATHNLQIVRTSDGKRFPLSTDAGELLFYGELDWVYQEEVYGRFDFKATWWSPTGAHLAYLRIDESEVANFTIVDHIPQRLNVETLRYPKAGDGNPKATMHIANAETGASVAVDLAKYPAEDQILIVRVTWTPDARHAVVQIQNREQTWLDLNLVDPATGKLTTLFRETSRAWVNILEQPRWLKDGGFLWDSERTGYRHLYRYDISGKLLNAVTSGEWQVKEVVETREAEGEIIFSATKDGAININYYRANLDGTGFVRLTHGPGSHAITWNQDRSLYLDTSSSIDSPGTQRLCKSDGTVVKEVATAPARERDLTVPVPELVSIPARDGYLLDAIVVRPVSDDPTKQFPIWIDTYSGPDSPTVRNSSNGHAQAVTLAKDGIISLRCNVRSASGRGQHHTDTCYKQFGVVELKDLEDAVDWVVANRRGDPKRVGITGFSYGGFMAAYALTHSKKFSVGIAGGGVFDWKLYDTIYTERYMRMPQNNEEGYKISSCVAAAADLNGHLVIVHGTMDDNVHVQNAYALAYALQRAGKDFEMMLYPKSRHGIGGAQSGHYQALIKKTIKKQL